MTRAQSAECSVIPLSLSTSLHISPHPSTFLPFLYLSAACPSLVAIYLYLRRLSHLLRAACQYSPYQSTLVRQLSHFFSIRNDVRKPTSSLSSRFCPPAFCFPVMPTTRASSHSGP